MIVVTGASRGLGRTISERLINQGHDVFGLARNVEDCTFPSLKCDVADPDSVKAAAKAIKKLKKPVKGLINAAGIASMNLVLTTPPASVQKIISTNLLGTIYTNQSFAPLIIRAGGGAIVNFSTIAVAIGLEGEAVYVASKAGVEGFSRTFAREMSGFGVRVNCIAPGPIHTDLTAGLRQEQLDRIINYQVIRQPFEREAVADLVDLLLDKRSHSIAGQVLHVGGV
ncbi:SDR family oxidoreductase [bacterium]|nr:SDR family oxidoreductase [bacterium]